MIFGRLDTVGLYTRGPTARQQTIHDTEPLNDSSKRRPCGIALSAGNSRPFESTQLSPSGKITSAGAPLAIYHCRTGYPSRSRKILDAEAGTMRHTARVRRCNVKDTKLHEEPIFHHGLSPYAPTSSWCSQNDLSASGNITNRTRKKKDICCNKPDG